MSLACKGSLEGGFQLSYAPTMVTVDETLTRRVAALARVELTSEETALFTGQMSKILDYVEILQSVDTQKIEPLVHPVEVTHTLFREDASRPDLRDANGQPGVLASAPETLSGGFKVPPIL